MNETVDTNQATVERPTGAPRWWVIGAIGALVVILSFFASFWGASLASTSADDAVVEQEQTPPATEEEPAVLPAGAEVRAGSGIPDPTHGSEGDVFIDVDSTDIFVRTADEWQHAGNIRTTALESLTGGQGEAGESGKTGEQGQQGEQGAQGGKGLPGIDGTQVVLGVSTPDQACEGEGDVFVNTVTLTFYQCTAGTWLPIAE